ncbi:transposase [Patescibacteria group bacterium]|nr:transposase [Patescibacteria group bacterium]
MLRKVSFVPDNYYHIYNRGVEKRNIFQEKSDYERFLALLYLGNDIQPVDIREHFREGGSFAELFNKERKENLVDIGAYCLMPNHFHLLLKPKTEEGLTVFMKKICTGYSMYFNLKNQRSGILFQGEFRANLADKDQYLKYLSAYIHLNPVKLIEAGWKTREIKNINKARKFLENYQWSSYLYYTGAKPSDPILNSKEFPEYFENSKEFNDFINDWIVFAKEGPSQELQD